VNAQDFGARGDGITLDTRALQAAIDAAALKRATLRLLPGTYLTGALFLKSGMTLQLDRGATLLGSRDLADYPRLPTRVAGIEMRWPAALVNIYSEHDVSLVGEGCIDGDGWVFWDSYWRLRAAYEPRGLRWASDYDAERPRLVQVFESARVNIGQGLQLRRSGFWTLHLCYSEDVTVDGVTIRNNDGDARGPSTDGIDIDSSQNVTVRKCYISTNDDNIALKGSKGPHADQDVDSPPVENILVEDTEIGEGNGLITCGSEATVVRNVTARNCVMSGSATMLTLKLRPDTPQHYERITLDGIKLTGNGRLLNVAPWLQFFDLKGQPPPARRVNDIVLRNITGRYRSWGALSGNAGDVLQDITLENVDVQLAEERFRLGPVENLVLKNVKVNGRDFVAPAVTPPPALPRGK